MLLIFLICFNNIDNFKVIVGEFVNRVNIIVGMISM